MKRVICPALACMLAACGGAPSGKQEKQQARRPAATPAAPKITQFYAAEGAIARGSKTLLCYGVENAARVRLTPQVEALYPAFSRCVEIRPEKTTVYTLTAEGEGGSTSSSFTVKVTAAAPRQAQRAQSSGPRIVSFTQQKKTDLTLLCYEVEDAEAVSMEPGVLPRSGALRGCLGVAPGQPASYTLSAYGPRGRVVKQTLQVNP